MKAEIDLSELEEYNAMLETLSENSRQLYVEATTKKIAGLMLAKIKKRTPVGKSVSHIDKKTKKKITDHVGGTLRRNWNVGQVKNDHGTCKITIINPTEYASYVEFGHRQTPGRYVPAIGKTLKKPWVKGRFMMRATIHEMKPIADRVAETELIRMLGKKK